MRTILWAFLVAGGALAQSADWRHIVNGSVIPDEFYADQPYVVKTDDGAWLCCLLYTSRCV